MCACVCASVCACFMLMRFSVIVSDLLPSHFCSMDTSAEKSCDLPFCSIDTSAPLGKVVVVLCGCTSTAMDISPRVWCGAAVWPHRHGPRACRRPARRCVDWWQRPVCQDVALAAAKKPEKTSNVSSRVAVVCSDSDAGRHHGQPRSTR